MGQLSSVVDQKAKTQLVIRDPLPEEVVVELNRLGDLPLVNFRELEEETVRRYMNQYGESDSLYKTVRRVAAEIGEDKDFFRILNSPNPNLLPMNRVDMAIIKYYCSKLPA